MEHIWSPWRFKFISSASNSTGCIFCRLLAADADRENYIVYRGQLNFIILNLYPYTSGHTMIVPYEHAASLTSLSQSSTSEMMELAKRTQRALDAEYHPDGFNIGMNLGASAGAGVADHVHLHVVPRWVGDANFVSVIGETRVLPEELSATYDKLKRHFDGPQ